MKTQPFVVNTEDAVRTLKNIIECSDYDQLANILGYVCGCEVGENPNDPTLETFLVKPIDGEYGGDLDHLS